MVNLLTREQVMEVYGDDFKRVAKKDLEAVIEDAMKYGSYSVQGKVGRKMRRVPPEDWMYEWGESNIEPGKEAEIQKKYMDIFREYVGRHKPGMIEHGETDLTTIRQALQYGANYRFGDGDFTALFKRALDHFDALDKMVKALNQNLESMEQTNAALVKWLNLADRLSRSKSDGSPTDRVSAAGIPAADDSNPARAVAHGKINGLDGSCASKGGFRAHDHPQSKAESGARRAEASGQPGQLTDEIARFFRWGQSRGFRTTASIPLEHETIEQEWDSALERESGNELKYRKRLFSVREFLRDKQVALDCENTPSTDYGYQIAMIDGLLSQIED